MKLLRVLTIKVFFIVLFGCSTGSAIVTGNIRTAIDPNEVKIYLNPPAQFETIGIVEASSDVEFSTQKAQDRVIDELKKQAAKIGANGVILLNTGNTSSGGAFVGGIYMAYNTKTARGQAIYVILE